MVEGEIDLEVIENAADPNSDETNLEDPPEEDINQLVEEDAQQSSLDDEDSYIVERIKAKQMKNLVDI